MNNNLLRIHMTPEEYLAVVGEDKPVSWDIYKSLIPVYKVAECPFCQADCLARLDTYSLFRWSIATPGNMWGFTKRIVNRCPHMIMGEFFINLNGLLPTEMEYLNTRSEIPFINPRLVDDTPWESSFPDMNPRAIMHALPICRIERKRFKRQFVPRYSLFTITYFGRHHAPMHVWWMKGFDVQGMQMPKYDAPNRDMWWDLEYWVDHSKLCWLNANKETLPVITYPHHFPYTNIQGHKAANLTYRNGKLSHIETRFIPY